MAEDKKSGFSVQEGGTVRPLYQERSMKCFVVTESELKSLSLANGLMTLFFSIASGSFVFGIDIAKDVAFSEKLTEGGQLMESVIQTVCYVVAGIFALAGIGAFAWRHGMLKLIREESTND